MEVTRIENPSRQGGTSFEAAESIALWDHADFGSRDDILRLVDMARARNRDVRIVSIARDPRELLLSGYFYHLRTHEPWAHKPVGMPPKCDNRSVYESPGCAIQEYAAKNFTYQEMLNAMPRDIGVLVEALRSQKELHAMNKSVAILRTFFPDISRIYDLDSITNNATSFANAFTDMFAFLGVHDVPECTNAASRHFFRPQITSRRGGHIMSSSLQPERDALRINLPTFPYYQTAIQPIRRDLFYF